MRNGVDEPRCFNGLERELAELPQAYLALFSCRGERSGCGCVGLRELDRGTAEMKRLYVRAPFRGLESDGALAEAAHRRRARTPVTGASCSTRCRK
jgi:hypothetical protein